MPSDDSPEQQTDAARPDGRSAHPASTAPRAGRHRAAPRRVRRPLRSTPARVTVAAGVACCLGLATVVGVRSAEESAPGPLPEALVDRAAAAAEAERRASRDLARTSPSPAGSPTAAPRPSATRKPAKPSTPPRPRRVAGLTQAQTANAAVVVDVGERLGIPRRGLVVAMATAMQESNLYNLASDVVPESLKHPHQGTGADHDSVGLFQQRPSSGWGDVADLMRPAYAAEAFFRALRKVSGWQSMSVAGAAQAVQISAYPDAYARHEDRATTIVDALT